jgi:hypothetical protein
MTEARTLHFRGNAFAWPIERPDRSFRVFVVEPTDYNPEEHDALFTAAIEALIAPTPSLVDEYEQPTRVEGPERFDLITFPEAFLSVAGLLATLQAVATFPLPGCVHVGLRPNDSFASHLFTVDQMKTLLSSIYKIAGIVSSDFDAFSLWLNEQTKLRRFNLGCLFAVDAEGKLRICLHPKIVRSRVEASALSELHMHEANLLSVVTLHPKDKRFFSVTIQPLLCSDALSLETSTPNAWPLFGVNDEASCFGSSAPDHVDVVSIPTCTRHPVRSCRTRGERYLSWHQNYLDSFLRAPSEWPRHFSAVFVMSNFRRVPVSDSHRSEPGGLSGVFLPIPLRHVPPVFAQTFQYGRNDKSLDNEWFGPNEGKLKEPRGYLATLGSNDLEDGTMALMLGFTVDRLLRNAARWQPTDGLVNFRLHRLAKTSPPTSIEMRERNE